MDPMLSALFGLKPPPDCVVVHGAGDLDDFLRSMMPPPNTMMGPGKDPLGAILDEFLTTALLAAGTLPPPGSEWEKDEMDGDAIKLPEEEREIEAAEAALDAMVGRLAERASSALAKLRPARTGPTKIATWRWSQLPTRSWHSALPGTAPPSLREQTNHRQGRERRRRIRSCVTGLLKRRLSEVDGSTFVRVRLAPQGILITEMAPTPPRRVEEGAPLSALGFGCCRDRCLWRVEKERAVSPLCAHAMEEARMHFNLLHIAQEEEHNKSQRDAVVAPPCAINPAQSRAQMQAQIRQQQHLRAAAEASAFSAFLLSFSLSLSIYVLLRLAFSAVRRNGGGGHSGGGRFGKRILRRKMLLTVYYDPELRSAVEERVGESLGNGPPGPPLCWSRDHLD